MAARFELLLRALVVALVLPLASSGALPVWSQLVGVEGPHVCRCSVERHDCACAKCNPDREDVFLTSESLKGRCGEDEIAFAGKSLSAVLCRPSVVTPPVTRAPVTFASRGRFEDLSRPPPTPPPRPSSSAT